MMEKKKGSGFFLEGGGVGVLIKVSLPEGSDAAAVQSGRDVQSARSVNLPSLKKKKKSCKSEKNKDFK